MKIRVQVQVDERLLRMAELADPILMHAVQSAQWWGIGEWARQASGKLRTAYIPYLRGLAQDASLEQAQVVPEGVQGAIVLVGKFPNMLEQGAPAFDIKVGLLKSDKVKRTKVRVTKDGETVGGDPYINVPFRHRTSGTGVAVGGNLMPKDIRGIAQRLPRGGVLTGAQMDRSRVLKGVGADYGRRSKLPVGGMAAPYTWKSSPFANMVRSGAPRHTQYMTWRRVSLRSDANSWWHPGLPGVKLVGRVAPEIELALQKFLDAEMRRVLGSS